MIELRLGIPNSPSLRYSVLNALVALSCLIAAGLSVAFVVQQRAFFMRHYIWWAIAELVILGVCAGMVLIFLEEAIPRELGQMHLTEESITIGDDAFLLSMIRKVTVVVRGYQEQVRGKSRLSWKSVNYITFYTYQRQEITCDFWLKSKNDFELLDKLLAIWQAHKIQVVREGIYWN